MMAQMSVGGIEMFDSMLYTKPHPGTQEFLRNQVDSGFNYQPTSTGAAFFDKAQEVYERFSGSTAMRKARAAARNVRALWQSDEIRPLSDVGEFQTAPQTMRRWVMAEPTVRALYQQQRCDGYSGSYIDNDPGTIGVDNYDYRRVMNGVVVMNDDPESDYEWSATTYMDELLPEDEELMFEEQVDILDSWENLRSHIRAKKSDPTSKWDADL